MSLYTNVVNEIAPIVDKLNGEDWRKLSEVLIKATDEFESLEEKNESLKRKLGRAERKLKKLKQKTQ